MTRAQFTRWRELAIAAVRAYQPTLVSSHNVPVPSVPWMEGVAADVLDAIEEDGIEAAPPEREDLMDLVMCAYQTDEAFAAEPSEVFDDAGGLLPAHAAWVALWVDSVEHCLWASLSEALS